MRQSWDQLHRHLAFSTSSTIKPAGQRVTSVGTGAPTLTDLGASFAVATGWVQTLFIAAPPNASSVWVRVVDEVSGAVFEQEITADLPATTQFLSPRLFLNNRGDRRRRRLRLRGGLRRNRFLTSREST